MFYKLLRYGKGLSLVLFILFVFACGTINAAEITLKYAHGSNAFSAGQLVAEIFKQLVEERTDGEIVVETFPGTLTASSEEGMSLLQQGAVDIFGVYTGHIAGFYRDVQFLSLPYLFNNHEHYIAANKSRPIKIILSGIEEETNLKVFGLLSDQNGFAISSIDPIRNIEDAKGMKLRCMQNPLYIDMYSNMGFAPTATDWGELYTSLQTGLVEANDLGVKSNYENHFNEVVECFAITNHCWTQFAIMMNQDSFNGLTPEQQEIVETSMEEAINVTDEYQSFREKVFIEKAKEEGYTVTYPDIEPFKKASQKTYDKWFEMNPHWEEWYEEIQYLDPTVRQTKAYMDSMEE